jgi:DNA invertase Pin-like site-specific DNA recombinase
MKKRACLYCRVSCSDQKIESQLFSLREAAAARGFEIVKEYCDRGFSGAKAKRPGLDNMLADARRHKFNVVFVAAFDRIARSTRHFLQVLDELEDLNIEFVSAREAIDTSSAMGRMFVTLIGSISELERSIIAERVRQGLHRAKLEGQKLGRRPLEIDHEALVRDRLLNGLSLTACSRKYSCSRASVIRWVREAQRRESAGMSGFMPMPERGAAVECIA